MRFIPEAGAAPPPARQRLEAALLDRLEHGSPAERGPPPGAFGPAYPYGEAEGHGAQGSGGDRRPEVDGAAAGWGVPAVAAGDLTPAAFAADYLLKNRPVLIRDVFGGGATWPCVAEWTTAAGGIAIDRLERAFGEARVTVTTCEPAGSARPPRSAPFADVCREWREREASEGRAEGRAPQYVKDWHVAQEWPRPDGDPYYTTPTYFQDDWLNGGKDLSGRQDGHDHRFVYMGEVGTYTPLHADVLRSFSWSVNVAGRKRWALVPPELSWCLFAANGDRAASFADDPARFPHLGLAAARALEVDQGVGEALFVPSGWFHRVENVEATLSVNHNWLNAANCRWGWALLRRDFREAAARIGDCRALCRPAEFRALVFENLKLNSGLDLADFAELLCGGLGELPRWRALETRLERLQAGWQAVEVARVLEELFAEVEEVLGAAGEGGGGGDGEGRLGRAKAVLRERVAPYAARALAAFQ